MLSPIAVSTHWTVPPTGGSGQSVTSAHGRAHTEASASRMHCATQSSSLSQGCHARPGLPVLEDDASPVVESPALELLELVDPEEVLGSGVEVVSEPAELVAAVEDDAASDVPVDDAMDVVEEPVDVAPLEGTQRLANPPPASSPYRRPDSHEASGKLQKLFASHRAPSASDPHWSSRSQRNPGSLHANSRPTAISKTPRSIREQVYRPTG